MPSTQLESSLVESRSGRSRLFMRGGERTRMSPRDTYGYLGVTTVGGLAMARGDKITFELPSDTDASGTAKRTVAQGAYETQTGNFSQVLSSTMNEPWWNAIRRTAPCTFFIPVGNTRQLQERNDWDSAILIDNLYIQSVSIDNEINPATNDDVPLPLNLNGDFQYESYDFHTINTLTFPASVTTSAGSATLAVDTVGTAIRETDEGLELFVLDQGTQTSTAAAGDTSATVFARNLTGTWRSGVELASALGTGTTRKAANDIAVVGNNLIIASNEAAGHVIQPVESIMSGTDASTLVTSGYVSGGGPLALYARSGSEIWIVGEDNKIYRANSLLGGVEEVGGLTGTEDLNDVDVYKQQFVAVGTDNTVIISNDLERFSSVTGPSSTTTDDMLCVAFLDMDTFLVGSGAGKLYYTEDMGSTWTEIIHGISGLSQVNDLGVSMTDSGKSAHVILVGATSTAGVIARSFDQGASWQSTGTSAIQSVPTATAFNSVSIVSPGTVLVAGNTGTGANVSGVGSFVQTD